MKDTEKVLKALANYRRLLILKFIERKREAPVFAVAAHIKLSIKSTSRHLAILRQADIVGTRQESTSVFYHLNPKMAAVARNVIRLTSV